MVMAIYGALLSGTKDPQEIEGCIDGNLCRCTGFRPILDAAHDAASSPVPAPPEAPAVETPAPPLRFSPSTAVGGPSWTAPTTLDALCDALKAPGSRLIAAGTGHGVAKYYTGEAWQGKSEAVTSYVDITRVPGMDTVALTSTALELGSCVTLTEMMQKLEENKEASTSFGPLASHMHRIANHQVRNVGTWAGNVMLARKHQSFTSDLNMILTGAGASVSIIDAASGKRSTMTLEAFHTMPPPASGATVLTQLSIPVLSPSTHFKTYKVALRFKNAHAVLNAAIQATTTEAGVCESVGIYFGGVGNGVTRARATEKALQGQNITEEATLQAGLKALEAELDWDPALGRTAYRAGLATSFLYKFILSLQPSLPPSLSRARDGYTRGVSSGTWTTANAGGDPSQYPLSEPEHKLHSAEQTGGEAVYTCDPPAEAGELHAVFVLTTVASGKITEIDTAAATALAGVERFVGAHELDQAGLGNALGAFDLWEEDLFCKGDVGYHGQPVGMVLASTRAIAEAAVRLVSVSYTGVSPTAVLDIDAAVKADSYMAHGLTPSLHNYDSFDVGDAAKAMKNADVVLTGTVSCGHQHHMYMETQAARVTHQNGGLMVNCGTQYPHATKSAIAAVTKLSMSKVEVRCERIGGGYGGKISRGMFTAAAAAAGAILTKRSCRIQMDLNANLSMLGSRRPHQFRYQIGVMKDGSVAALSGDYYSNQGHAEDIARQPDGNEIQLSIDSAYKLPNVSMKSYRAKCSTPTNTYARSPNFTPGTFIIESIMERVAENLKMAPEEVRMKNMYKAGDITLSGTPLPYCNLSSLYREMEAEVDWTTVEAEVVAFNAANSWVKQGHCIVPMKFPSKLATGYHAVVTAHGDGSVLVQHGGIDMGQGIGMKVAQAAAFSLGAPLAQVSVDATTTKVATGLTELTGASITSEGCCASVRLACEDLKKKMAIEEARLEGQLEAPPTWEQLAAACERANADMTGKGQYEGKNDGSFLPAERKDSGGTQYETYGVGYTRVQLDCLTGELQLLRSDVLMDCGRSLNPTLDAGQLQGGFVMGLGYFLSEEFIWDEGSKSAYEGTVVGRNLTNGTWEYKPPFSQDIPLDFNIKLEPNHPNPFGIFGSKCSGEPSVSLASSAVFAAQHALAALRQQSGGAAAAQGGELDAPCTVERLFLAGAVDPAGFRLA